MTKKQKPKVEIEFDRDDPPPDDFHQVKIFSRMYNFVELIDHFSFQFIQH